MKRPEARAERAFAAISACATFGRRARVGSVEKVGDGASREIFAAEVATPSGASWRHQRVAVLLPREGGAPDLDARTQREARLLEFLAGEELPFRVPRLFGVSLDPDGLALVRSFEPGLELELGAAARGRTPPWVTIARVASAIHGIAPRKLAWLGARFSDRRALALAMAHTLDGMHEPEIADARVWMLEHLPPATPCMLVHGDLHGANILLETGEPDAVIDWEYAQLGDPAFELAVITRGRRRPFQIERGLDRLLDAYAKGPAPVIGRTQVHFYELALAATWYRQSLRGEGTRGLARPLRLLRDVLRRAEAAPNLCTFTARQCLRDQRRAEDGRIQESVTGHVFCPPTPFGT